MTPTTNSQTKIKRGTRVLLAQQTAVGISRTESLCWPCLCQTDECGIAACGYVRTEVNQPGALGHYFNTEHGHFVQAKHEKIKNNYTIEIVLSYDIDFQLSCILHLKW